MKIYSFVRYPNYGNCNARDFSTLIHSKHDIIEFSFEFCDVDASDNSNECCASTLDSDRRHVT